MVKMPNQRPQGVSLMGRRWPKTACVIVARPMHSSVTWMYMLASDGLK